MSRRSQRHNVARVGTEASTAPSLLPKRTAERPTTRQAGPSRRFWWQFRCFLFLEEVVVVQSPEAHRCVLLVVPDLLTSATNKWDIAIFHIAHCSLRVARCNVKSIWFLVNCLSKKHSNVDMVYHELKNFTVESSSHRTLVFVRSTHCDLQPVCRCIVYSLLSWHVIDWKLYMLRVCTVNGMSYTIFCPWYW